MQESFSHIAPRYDLDFTHTSIGVKQRRQVYKVLLPFLSKKHSVLEVNGGTGEDAVFLASHCQTVLTTDISPEMVALAESKTRGLHNVSTDVLDLNDLASLQEGDYSLIFSNFGGLNCLSPKEVGLFLKNACDLLSTNGMIIAVIMGRKTLWERLYFTLKRDGENKRRRRGSSPVESNVKGKMVKTWYYSPSEIKTLLPPSLRCVKIRPIGLLVPPSYLQTFFNQKKVFLNVLYFLDGLLGSTGSDYADHYCICVKKEG